QGRPLAGRAVGGRRAAPGAAGLPGERPVTAAAPAIGAGIRLEGLAKSYGPVQAVRGVDIWIAAGEIVALLGPNGAGKSTTTDMLLGLARPDRGQVSVFGHGPAAAIDRGLVGAMLQSGALIRGLTVRERV